MITKPLRNPPEYAARIDRSEHQYFDSSCRLAVEWIAIRTVVADGLLLQNTP